MCGIFGIYSLTGKIKLEKEKVDEAINVLHHRGPDFQQTMLYNEDTIALAHARLSVINLFESVIQPMHVGKYSVIFDGEIYNYIELREELSTAGYIFHTNSDTEVLVNAFDYWNENCVNKFNGMWAFSILDIENRKLFCSRDRYGIKPFNYYCDNDKFIFSSEIKAILQYDSILKRPNYNSISLFAREGICGEIEETWFENVKRLMPGHNLIINNGEIEIKQYYQFPTKIKDIGFEEAKKEFYNIFIDSVRLRMRSDVPVGTTLSGGLDSSSIVSALRTFYDGEHNTFTAHFPDFKDDELNSAMRINDFLNLKGNPIEIDFEDNYIKILRDIVYHLESGHLSPSVFPLWKIYEKSRKEVTVILEGQGADEALGGYISSVAGIFFIEQIKELKFRNLFKQFKLIKNNYGIKNTLVLTTRIYSSSKIRAFLRRYILNTENVFTGHLKGYQYPISSKNTSPSLLTRHLIKSHQTTLVNLLHYGDALSMAHGLESRLPFMDFRLVEFAFTLPSEYLINDGKGKYILREALKDILPLHIYQDHKKLGFPSPIDDFFKKNKLLIKSILLSDKARSRDLYNYSKLNQLIDNVGNKNNSERLVFRLLCIEVWFNIFIDKL